MKKIFIILAFSMVLFSLIAIVAATDTGGSIGINISTQKFAPRVYFCDNRSLADDNLQNSNNGLDLSERKHNYAFEGESIHWTVLVLDKNKIEDVTDVVGTIGPTQGAGNDVEVECKRLVGDPFGNSTRNITTITDITCFSNETAPINVTSLLAAITCSVYEPLAGNNITCSLNGITNSTAFAGSGNIVINGTNISFSAGATEFTFNATVGGIPGNCSVGNLITTNSSGSCSFNINNIVTVGVTGVNNTCTVNGVSNSVFATSSGVFNLPVNGVNISVFVSSGTTVDFNSTIEGVSGNCSVTGLLNSTSNGQCSFSIANNEIITVGDPFSECNARVDQFKVTSFDPAIMAYYDCHFTVETANSMHGEYFLTVEADDAGGKVGTMAENEYWFLNPLIGLSISDDLQFSELMPGTDGYSQTILVENDAESGSGVILDMFISGTDFYDPASSGALCPSTNQLALTNFKYYATNGAFSTKNNIGADAQGYLPIPYSTDISGSKRIIRFNGTTSGINCSDPTINNVLRPDAIRGSSPSSSVVEQDWNCGNTVSPGSEMALTFKLSLPEPCNGDFSNGQIFFWGEAI
ncbi:Uncharacterised protein [uncultured archaeon]|nr:Uncharacterised protein [uncultured archaeon]